MQTTSHYEMSGSHAVKTFRQTAGVNKFFSDFLKLCRVSAFYWLSKSINCANFEHQILLAQELHVLLGSEDQTFPGYAPRFTAKVKVHKSE
jgi:hypothetical protein